LIPLREPVGTSIGLATAVAQLRVQDVTIFSLCRRRFVLAHSITTHFRVEADIVSPARVVLKYFTQSTIAPWNGEESTFVDTYSAAVWIDWLVTSSNCVAVSNTYSQAQEYAQEREALAEFMIE